MYVCAGKTVGYNSPSSVSTVVTLSKKITIDANEYIVTFLRVVNLGLESLWLFCYFAVLPRQPVAPHISNLIHLKILQKNSHNLFAAILFVDKCIVNCIHPI